MGWDQRGNNRYYYKKEREGSRVKSTYVGRGEVAHMVAKFESSSAELERLMRAKKSMEASESERAEVALERAVDLIQLFTQASLISAGFHTHKRQWRRKRNVG
jgi:predicted negative regulator of RcsB-dependent stress response